MVPRRVKRLPEATNMDPKSPLGVKKTLRREKTTFEAVLGTIFV